MKNSLSSNHSALVLFDRIKSQCTPTVLQLLSDNNIQVVIVPANLTDRLQPLDVSVNKAVKDFMRKKFSTWYSEQLCSEIKSSNPTEQFKDLIISQSTVDLNLLSLKPLGAQWLMSMFDYFTENEDIIKNGFIKAGIKLSN